MKKFVPYEKLSKKARKERDAKKRVGWGELNPVTRASRSEKMYNRKRTGRDVYDASPVCFFVRNSCAA